MPLPCANTKPSGFSIAPPEDSLMQKYNPLPASLPLRAINTANSSNEQLLTGPLLYSSSAVIPSLMLILTDLTLSLQNRSSKMILPPIGMTGPFHHRRSYGICIVGKCSYGIITQTKIIIGAISPSWALLFASLTSFPVPTVPQASGSRWHSPTTTPWPLRISSPVLFCSSAICLSRTQNSGTRLN
jgi:hypothetical protein